MLIDIASISLDVKNFRHGAVGNEAEALRVLLSDEKTHKVSELAQDIINEGQLDPSSLLIVTPESPESEKYIALEGNRRITALKALLTPELASGTPGYSVFKSLHKKFLETGIKQVDCVVLERSQAAVWIKRKHYRGMGGAGTLRWNAVATARSDAAEGKHSRWMTALAFLENHGVETDYIREAIATKTSTVERVLGSPKIASDLGLLFGRNGQLTPENNDNQAAAALILQMFDAMAVREFVETKVSLAGQQAAFIEQFQKLNVKKAAIDPEPVAPDQGGPDQHDPEGRAPDSDPDRPRPPKKKQPSKRPVALRKNLAKSGLNLKSVPLEAFYYELKSLNVEKNRYVSSVVIRIFLEKLTQHFLMELKIKHPDHENGVKWSDFNVKLKDKVAAALNYIDKDSSKDELRYARDIANGVRDKLHTADHLNSSIHNHQDLPSFGEIITIWDRFDPYFCELARKLEEDE